MPRLDDYTVIMSVYKKVKPEHLKESINSILRQTHVTNEFIIIKDGDLSPEAEKIIQEFKKKNKLIFKVHGFKDNAGAGRSYNKALSLCTNKWAAIMDSDDIAHPEKFEKQLQYLSTHKKIDVIGTNAIEFIDEENHIYAKRKMPKTNDEIIKFGHARCPLIQPTAIFRVDSVKKAGSYQESPLTEDYDLYIRMIMNGCNFFNLQEYLYSIRTSKDFFKRRGGIKYLSKILRFKYKYYKKGFYSSYEFFKTSTASIVAAMLPNKIRVLVYKKFLRN